MQKENLSKKTIPSGDSLSKNMQNSLVIMRKLSCRLCIMLLLHLFPAENNICIVLFFGSFNGAARLIIFKRVIQSVLRGFNNWRINVLINTHSACLADAVTLQWLINLLFPAPVCHVQVSEDLLCCHTAVPQRDTCQGTESVCVLQPRGSNKAQCRVFEKVWHQGVVDPLLCIWPAGWRDTGHKLFYCVCMCASKNADIYRCTTSG